MQVAVCGPSTCTDAEARAAFEVGRQLVRRDATVLCGGGAGVMAAVAAGARSLGGTVVGILPGAEVGDRPDLSVAVATGMGQARNAVLVNSAEAIIVVGGSWGTLSEVALAMRRPVRVVSLGGWHVVDQDGVPVPGILTAHDPAHAVDLALTRDPS